MVTEEQSAVLREVVGGAGDVVQHACILDGELLEAVVEGLSQRTDTAGYEWVLQMIAAVLHFRQQIIVILDSMDSDIRKSFLQGGVSDDTLSP